MSATPGEWELERSSGGNRTHTQLIIRPTGIVDPVVECRPSEGQITDVVAEIRRRIELDQRTLITTLTKRMAEEVGCTTDSTNMASCSRPCANHAQLHKILDPRFRALGRKSCPLSGKKLSNCNKILYPEP